MSDEQEDSSNLDLPVVAAGRGVANAMKPDGLLTLIYKDRFQKAVQRRGDESAEKVREELESRRRQERENNFRRHINNIESIEEGSGERLKFTSSNGAWAMDWADGIADIDPDDENLTAFWYAAYEAAKNDADYANYIMETVEKLDKLEAGALLQAKKGETY